ncbi:MAG: transcription-repair coupling factor, partial [Bacteroidia bacterium]|nr:transcription-repair coupling factor [Bacteroidia bacterium]
GFINEIGFETYQKILNEAIDELKENEFKSLYHDDDKERIYVKDITIDSSFELLFPDDYVNNITERLNLYTRLNELKTTEELERYEDQLTDRFGELPAQVVDLLDSVRLKWLAAELGLEKIVMKHEKLVGYFIKEQESPFYQGPVFTKVLKYVQKNPTACKMKEKQTRQGLRLLLTFERIKSVEDALSALRPILA